MIKKVELVEITKPISRPLAKSIIKFLIEKEAEVFYTEGKPTRYRRFVVFRKVEPADRKNGMEITSIDRDKLLPASELM